MTVPGLRCICHNEIYNKAPTSSFSQFQKLQIVESLRKLRKRRIRILVLTQSVSDVDMIYGKDERKAMLGNFAFVE